MGTATAILEFITLVIADIKEWMDGGDSKLDYSEFAKRLGGKFQSELLLAREKARLAKKVASTSTP